MQEVSVKYDMIVIDMLRFQNITIIILIKHVYYNDKCLTCERMYVIKFRFLLFFE